ncbi:MAG: hypothetical protein RLZZ328_1400 [Bacteroidota bacterium]|jgi:hypothetical protein
MTTFENKCRIMGQLWLDYRDKEDLSDFFEYNDIGLPLSYMLSEKIVDQNELSSKYVEETWNIFLGALEISEDLGWSSLDDIFAYAAMRKED